MKSRASVRISRTPQGATSGGNPATWRRRAPKRAAAMEILKRFRYLLRAGNSNSRTLQKWAGVSGTQLWALHELEQHPGMSMTGLAEALALHQSTTSNLMDNLLRRQLVRRQRDRMDSRVGHLYLTRAGERALRTAPVPARNVLLEALEHLSPERLRLLDCELTTLLQRIREVHCSRL